MGGPPSPDDEPDIEQLVALKKLLELGYPPFVDFSGDKNVISVKLAAFIIGWEAVPCGFSDLHAASLPHSSSFSAPRDCIWTKQIRSSLTWVSALSREQLGSLQQHYRLSDHYGEGKLSSVAMRLPCCVRCLQLMPDGVPLAYFSSEVTHDDCKLLSVPLGDSASQQVMETLTLNPLSRSPPLEGLLAAGCRPARSQATLCSDSVAALILVLVLKAHGLGQA
eukprot:3083038-Amphidinium_carterae.1